MSKCAPKQFADERSRRNNAVRERKNKDTDRWRNNCVYRFRQVFVYLICHKSDTNTISMNMRGQTNENQQLRCNDVLLKLKWHRRGKIKKKQKDAPEAKNVTFVISARKLEKLSITRKILWIGRIVHNAQHNSNNNHSNNSIAQNKQARSSQPTK